MKVVVGEGAEDITRCQMSVFGVVAWLLEALYVHYDLVTTLEIRPTYAMF